MITISLCMIVKNEEAVLERCLSSIAGLMDEIIIVDTGSVDKTKEIAKKYTDYVYDFQWEDDFSAARNFSFSKASMEYIYVADADEVIDKENYKKFEILKEAMLPEIEIVQMYYTNQLQFNTTYNYDKEYRGKLYKRQRQFTWVDPIHETVHVNPIVYDSEIEILHMPINHHAKRDFQTIQKVIKRGDYLSKKLHSMYAKELFITGEEQDFFEAENFFKESIEDTKRSQDEIKEAACVLVKIARLKNDVVQLMKYALKDVATEASSEICYELGEYFFEKEDYKEASIWYYNAAYETSSILNIHYSGDMPLKRLANCSEQLGNIENKELYERAAQEWSIGQN